MPKYRAILCVAALLGAPIAQPADASFLETSFSEVSAIFARECVMCHQPYDAKGDLTLHPAGAWASLVGVGSTQVDMLLVTSGNLEQSYLYHKLTDTHTEIGGSGDKMPFDAALSAEQLATIRAWIEQGAKNE